MPPRADDRARLRHMLEHAEMALRFTAGRRRQDLDEDGLFELGSRKALEIVGEAAAQVTEGLRLAHPGVPWAQIVALRNRLVHGYDIVDHDILWSILTVDLPVLVAALRPLVGPTSAHQDE